MTRLLHLLLLGLFWATASALPGQVASAEEAKSWPQEKCDFYARAWHDLYKLSDRAHVTDAFVEGNEAFIAAGCSNGADVCPSSKADIDLANNLTMAAMNFGTASSFLPFICRQPR